MPLPKNLPRSDLPTSVVPSSALAGKRGVLANRYCVEHKLGSGAFGCAYLVTDLRAVNSERKVLKQIVVAELQPDETVDAVREARLLAKLDHPSIVKFHDSFMDGDFFCIITEYCEGGDLDEKIRQWREAGRTFEESLILDWFIQLTTAVRYIHERRILHRDLKTRNIFLKNNLIKLGVLPVSFPDPHDGLGMRLDGDFGISRILMGTSDLATTFTGTPYYMSPEVLKHDGYNAKSDIWSLGVVLYELCTLEHAFQGQNLMAVMYKIVEGEQPQLPSRFNRHLKVLFRRMLDKEPMRRPAAVEILRETFVQQRMEKLRGRMSMQMVPSTQLAEEAEAIARALSPVKKKSLMQDEGRAMTPRQQMALRKQQKADKEAEERRKIATKNFSEGKRRFREHRKRQARVVPPWVEEHPDVFNDPEFSITQLDSTASDTTASAMDVSLNPKPLAWTTENRGHNGPSGDGGEMDMSVDAGGNRPLLHQLQDGENQPLLLQLQEDQPLPFQVRNQPLPLQLQDGKNRPPPLQQDGGNQPLPLQLQDGKNRPPPLQLQDGGNQPLPLQQQDGGNRPPPLQLHGGRNWPPPLQPLSVDEIPQDPVLAETHYSQFDDFEADESSYSESEDDYEAFLGCIEDALDLPNQPAPEPVLEPSHDEISPFTPLAREKRIGLLRAQCQQIYGVELFQKVYEYLKASRSTGRIVDEGAVMVGLRGIVSNVRDCFLVDQIVFLEKQAESNFT